MDWLISTAPTWATLAGFILAAFSAGATGGLFKPDLWYRELSKPAWTPPNWLFPIAWTLLYIAMSIAAWWISLGASIWVVPALTLWVWQIVLNALWSPVFFGLKNVGAALVVVVVLWVAVASTALAFWWLDPLAGALMLPYVVWVSYAAALNFDIWRRNRIAQPRLATA